MDVSDVSDYQIWANKGLHPLVNFNFTLQVEGIYNLPCKSVHVFQRENEYEYYQEGGLNDYVHMLRKPISKPMTFQVERYVGVDMLDPLALGTDLILPVLLSVSRYQGEGGAGGWEQPQRIYTFTGCTVIAKEFGELHAENAGLLVETTTIAYREMVCLDNPVTGLKKQAWNIKNDKGADGRSKTKYAKTPLDVLQNVQEKELEETGDIKTDKETNGLHRAKYVKTIIEILKEVEQKRKWDIKKDREADGRPKTKFAKTPLDVLQNVQEKELKEKWDIKKDREADGRPKTKYAKTSIDVLQDVQEKELKEKWDIKKDREADGRPKIKFAKLPDGMLSKAEMQERAQMYVDNQVKEKPMHVLNYKGKKVSSKKNYKTGETKIGIAEKRAMTPREELEKEARRYFLSTSKLKNAYKGTIQQSAVAQKQMLGQAAMTKAQMEQAAKRRQWPPNRSAAQVAAFLKNKK